VKCAKGERKMNCPDVKFCEMCGKKISDINDPNTDWMSHIRIKYCPECAAYRRKMNRRNWASKNTDAHKTVEAFLGEYSALMREQISELKEQVELVKLENDLLRKQIIDLRE
jgi:ribosome-binding protein aMBF1 (putative translation factor)